MKRAQRVQFVGEISQADFEARFDDIQALDYLSEHVGCYKAILDCSEANEGFYVKCGFKRAGLEMAHYYEKK